MSKENFVKFYDEHALKTPDIEAKLQGAKDQPQFAQIAVSEGSKLGLSFTASEVADVMAATEQKSGALSDDQLSAVVGGAGAIAPVSIKAVPMKIGTATPTKIGNPPGPTSDWGGCW